MDHDTAITRDSFGTPEENTRERIRHVFINTFLLKESLPGILTFPLGTFPVYIDLNRY